MLMADTVVEAWLSAASVADPVADCPAPSPDKVWGLAHVATPESVSVHANVTVTGALCQPAAFAGGVAPVMCGGVLSMLSVVVADEELPALSVAVPDTGWPAPSVPTVRWGVQLATPEPSSPQVNVTVTSVLFHPDAFASGDCDTVIDGAVLSILTVAVCVVST